MSKKEVEDITLELFNRCSQRVLEETGFFKRGKEYLVTFNIDFSSNGSGVIEHSIVVKKIDDKGILSEDNVYYFYNNMVYALEVE